MYIYCACPDEKLKSNFILINYCNKYKELEKIFDECSENYGESYKKYYIEVNKKIDVKKLY